MTTKTQIIATIAIAFLFLVVFELVRRRRLLERYALLWLGATIVLFMLAVWTGLLESLTRLVGIATPSNALFLAAFAFVLVLLLHFSLAISRLSDETKILAQQLARLDQEASERARAQERPEEDALPPPAPDPVAEAPPVSSAERR
jgi:hypothetical protein